MLVREATRPARCPLPDPVSQDLPWPDVLTAPHSRRSLLGLLATTGAVAAAARLGLPGGRDDGVHSRVDPATALQVAVTGVTRGVDAAVRASHGAHGPAGDEAVGPAATTAEAVAQDELGHRVWSGTVTVGLAVRNTADREVLFSPGQVRLRLADGTGVMPVSSERGAGPLPPSSLTRTWVRYLAPDDSRPVTVDYTPAGATDPVPLPVAGAATGRGAEVSR